MSEDAGKTTGKTKEVGIYMCTFCGYIFDEEKAGMSITELKKCPPCQKPAYVFKLLTKKTVPVNDPE